MAPDAVAPTYSSYKDMMRGTKTSSSSGIASFFSLAIDVLWALRATVYLEHARTKSVCVSHEIHTRIALTTSRSQRECSDRDDVFRSMPLRLPGETTGPQAFWRWCESGVYGRAIGFQARTDFHPCSSQRSEKGKRYLELPAKLLRADSLWEACTGSGWLLWLAPLYQYPWLRKVVLSLMTVMTAGLT
jgi:hypothetical protein